LTNIGASSRSIASSAFSRRSRASSIRSSGGAVVPGNFSPDHTSWTPSAPLAFGTGYTFSGAATDPQGRAAPVTGTFSTLRPSELVHARVNITDGSTVGIAAPIVVQFDGHVADRASAERALMLTATPPTEGSWGWLQDDEGGSRVFWRPTQYWKPGTKATLAANLYGVDLGGGSFGAANVGTNFTVGRAQITKADVQSHQLVVLREGAEVARYNASYGKESDPDRNTHFGVHVITEKFTDKRMINQQYHYDVVEKWAVRMSNNGEFIHANPETEGVQGSANVSHGCVNLSSTDAKQYYDMAMYGDPVEVTGSKVALSARDGDIWIWTVPWSAWRTYSALDELN
jgi:lipoprotein-anchoring transpeptidase ErfK/SrfK